jgi:peptidoglycan/xylan/chitin deacetylase (PgdA/CDA1 family)
MPKCRSLCSLIFLLSASTSFSATVLDDEDAEFFGPPPEAVAIFMYHGLDEAFGFNDDSFVVQMQYLADNGYNTITLEHLKSWIETGLPELPQKPIVITFDDNYITVYTVAYPIMQQLGFFGYNYAHTKYVGIAPGGTPATGNDHADWIECAEMEAAGVLITESHTLSHLRLPTLTDANLKAELEDSKAAIEEEMDKVCRHLAYPYGGYDQRVLTATAAAGYETAVTTESGLNTRSTPLLQLKRYAVNPNSTNGGTGLNSGFMTAANSVVGGNNWQVSTASPGYLGVGYHYSNPDEPGNRAQWSFDAPTTGTFRISARWPAAPNYATDAPFTVAHDGFTTTVPVNQQTNGGQWNALVTRNLTAGETVTITLSNEADGVVVADGLQIEQLMPTYWLIQ